MSGAARIDLRIGEMVYGGSGRGLRVAEDDVGRDEGEFPRADLAVPFVLPGELVSVGGDRVGIAADVVVLEPSAKRTVPRCRHFEVCGGCQYQHAEYGTQLRIKEGILRGLLEGAGLRELPGMAVHAGEPWGYRNRVRMRVAEVDGSLRVGYSSRLGGDGLPREGAPEFLPIVECPIAAPVLWRGAEVFRRFAEESRQAGGRWVKSVVEVEFFATADEGRLQMTVYVREGQGTVKAGERELARLCDGMRAVVPELVGAAVMALPAARPGAGSRAAQRPKLAAAWGVPGLNYVAGGRSYWVSRGGFFQVNRFLLDELVRLVTKGRRGEVAWDLFAGVGLFSRALAETYGEVVAVESGEVAGTDLAGGARTLGGQKTGLRAVRMPVVAFLEGAVVDRGRPELVVMDPPRAGVGLKAARLLGRIGAAEMVYVSCDPTTLARDLRAMVDSGYNLAELHLVDLFPQTFHMETVAVLRRR